MELIFELTNRTGRTLERHRICSDRITIGRAYDNQLILSDDTISPNHAELYQDQAGEIVLRDLDSTNGITDTRHQPLQAETVLESGKEYIFGKTRVRIFTPDHPITETVSLNKLDGAMNYFGNTTIGIASMLLLMLLTGLQIWSSVVAEYKWEDFINSMLGVMAVTLFITLFWCLIGRIVKHEMRFKAQFTVIALYFSLLYCVIFAYEIILYNSMSYLLTTGFFIVLLTALLASLFWFNLHLATTITNSHRWKTSVFLAAVIMSVSVLPDIIEKNNFSTRPDYIAEIKAPVLRFVSGQPVSDFIQDSEAIFIHDNK